MEGYFESEKFKEVRAKYLKEQKEYRESEEGKIKIKSGMKKFLQTDKGKLYLLRQSSRRRKLGSISLNLPFECSEGHHIDKYFILNIPKKIHRSIPHNNWTGKNMEAINKVAFKWLQEIEDAKSMAIYKEFCIIPQNNMYFPDLARKSFFLKERQKNNY